VIQSGAEMFFDGDIAAKEEFDRLTELAAKTDGEMRAISHQAIRASPDSREVPPRRERRSAHQLQ